jgi:hypothetical protein
MKNLSKLSHINMTLFSRRFLMKNTVAFFVCLIVISCNTTSKNNLKIEGFWIPETVNWEDGSFNTFYFYNDTAFLLLSSTQKLINDSIYFQSESGFVLKQGSFKIRSKISAEIRFRTLYRLIHIEGDTIPSTLSNDWLILNVKDQRIKSFLFAKVRYLQTFKFDDTSRKTINSFLIKLVPNIKKEFGLD